VQIGFGDEAYCIDVLEIEDLSPLTELLLNESVVKVFHSCRQDFEVLYQRLDVIPKPVFDTQLAAAFCGYDAQAGYAKLVMDELDVELDKSQTRTDWSRRPLSDKQIAYAAEDVIYLNTLYSIMQERLVSLDKLDLYQEENETLYKLDDYQCKPENSHKRLNGASMTAKSQQYLLALAHWREATAQDRNIPRTWVLKDKDLYEIAGSFVLDQNRFNKSDIARDKLVRRHTKKIIALANEVEAKGDFSLIWDAVSPLDADGKKLVKDLVQRVSRLSEDSGIAQSLLATRKDVEATMRGSESGRISQGWRSKLVLPALKELLTE